MGCCVRRSGPEEPRRQTFFVAWVYYWWAGSLFRAQRIWIKEPADTLHLLLMRTHYITEQRSGRRRKSFSVSRQTQSVSAQTDAISCETCPVSSSLWVKCVIFKDTRLIWRRLLSRRPIASVCLSENKKKIFLSKDGWYWSLFSEKLRSRETRVMGSTRRAERRYSVQ